MTKIKPIETRYKGYRFRSRLEARWAVFFDTLGIAWEYEREGFNLDGVCYLPDFWLPQVEMWAEVKGAPFTPEESALCLELAKETDRNVLMLSGLPDYKPYPFYRGEYARVGRFGDLAELLLTREYLLEKRLYKAHSRINGTKRNQESWLKKDSIYIRAVNAARSARFEHGENGNW